MRNFKNWVIMQLAAFLAWLVTEDPEIVNDVRKEVPDFYNQQKKDNGTNQTAADDDRSHKCGQLDAPMVRRPGAAGYVPDRGHRDEQGKPGGSDGLQGW
jgi:hypothetical protein